MNEDIDPESIDKVRVKREKNVLGKYSKNMSGGWELDLDGNLDVLHLIDGNLESKLLYSDDRIKLDWSGFKKNGAHKIDTGRINFIDQLDGKKFAGIVIEQGYAKQIIIYKKQFADNIDNYKNMPLYSAIKKTLV